MENWIRIRGFEIYSVSDLGRVKNEETGRILKPRISNHGTNKHAKVKLSMKKWGGGAYEKFVHRLVADTFIRELTKDDIVNHKNGVQTDNRLENLEICDLSENGRHSFALRSKMSRFEAVFIPVENSSYQGLYISISKTVTDNDELIEFLQSKNFQCLGCSNKMELKSIVQNYLDS